MKNIISLAFLTFSLLLLSCSSIILTPKQGIKINSTPSGATVFNDSIEVGKTPMKLIVKRKEKPIIRIYKEGYETKRRINSLYIANVVIGGVIGLAVDAITGAM